MSSLSIGLNPEDGLSYIDHDHDQNLTFHHSLNGNGTGDLYNDTHSFINGSWVPGTGQVEGPVWHTSIFGTLLIVPEWEAALTAFTLSLIIILTLVGNFLVIVSVFTYRPLKTAPNFFIVSLAVADMTVALLVLPLNVAYSILGRWVLGKIVCEIWLTCDVLCCTASILHLSITDPVNYARKRTVERVLWTIAIVWVMSFLISSPPMLGWNDWPNDFNENTACTLTSEQGYVIYSALGSFFIPLVLMTAVYIRIFIATRRRLRQRAKASRLSAMARQKSIESHGGKKNGRGSGCGGDGTERERSSISSIENNGNDGSGDHCLQRSAESMNTNKNTNTNTNTNTNLNINSNNLATSPNSNSNISIANINLSICTTMTPNQIPTPTPNANAKSNTNTKGTGKKGEKGGKERKVKNCTGKGGGNNRKNSEDNETARNSRGILKGRLQSQLTVDDYDGVRLGLGPATNISDESVTDADIPLNPHHPHPHSHPNASPLTNANTNTNANANANANSNSNSQSVKHHNHHGSTKEGKSGRGSKKSNRLPAAGGQVSQFVEEKQRISLSKERKAARTLGIIMGSFVICWLPFFLMYVILPFCEDCYKPSQKLSNFITWLGYVNSFLNPVIYTIFNMDFRKAFKKILRIA